MKKILILLLVLLMALATAALTACGGGSDAENAEGSAEMVRQGEEDIPNGSQKIPAFETENLKGDKVTEDIFADKDVTMINFWGTFCGPCIAELPDLQALSEKLPENAQLIGILEDVPLKSKENLKEGKSLVKENGVTYENLLLDESLAEYASAFSYVPTTVFVDSKGKLLGHVVVGGYMKTYVANLEELLDGWTYEE